MSQLTYRDGAYEGQAARITVSGIDVLVIAPSRDELLLAIGEMQPGATIDPLKFSLVQVSAIQMKGTK